MRASLLFYRVLELVNFITTELHKRFLYMVYLVAAVNLAFRARWSPVKTVLVMLAGTIPFLSFAAERRVTADELAREEARPATT